MSGKVLYQNYYRNEGSSMKLWGHRCLSLVAALMTSSIMITSLFVEADFTLTKDDAVSLQEGEYTG